MKTLAVKTGKTIAHVEIMLAGNEWGSRLMTEVATAAIAAAIDRKHLLVTVVEHGGWWLKYAYLNDCEVVVVGSANDQAEYSKRVIEWWTWANSLGFGTEYERVNRGPR